VDKTRDMKTLIFIFCCALSLYSCKAYLKATGNYKEPEYESREAVKSYVHNYGTGYDGLFVCKSKEKMKFVIDSVNNSIPFIMVFDKDFRYLHTDQKCPWKNAGELDSLQNNKIWVPTDEINFARLNESIECINGKTVGAGYRFYIFYFWAKYIPKLSQDMIKQVQGFSQAKKEGIYIGAINMDLQEGWK
jgi:hypothetical protein